MRSLISGYFSLAAWIASAFIGAPIASAQITAESPASTEKAPVLTRPGSAGLARGVNFGNMLEGPFEGAWGLTVEEVFFDKVVEAEMDHIRLPVSWTYHTDIAPPYAIDPEFMDRVAWCLDQAAARGLRVILNVHHYDELNADPVGERARALAIWQQIATRFADRPETGPDAVYFEVLNEPHGAFNTNPTLWDDYLVAALGVIRQTNPTRWVMAGPTGYNAISALGSFELPADDRLMGTVHFYEPFAFTHQGAEWVDPSPPIGTEWTGAAIGFATPWQNWSWGTDVSQAGDGLLIDYQLGWAGLYLKRLSLLEDVTSLRIFADIGTAINVIVGIDGEDVTIPLDTAIGPRWYEVDVPAGASLVDKVIIQNASPIPQDAWTLSRVEIITENGSAEVAIGTEAQAIESSMRVARRWAKQQNNGAGVPLYLGEFGAYSTADMTSRVLWTRNARRAAERNGMGWGYWELGAGFGFYEPASGEFRQPLLNALTD